MPLVRRRPLLRGAMVAGAGYAAGRSHANTRAREEEQEQRLAELEQQQYAAPPPAYAPEPAYAPAAPAPMSMEQKAAQLTQLKELLDSGVLTQEEFDAQKRQILAS